MGGGGGEGGGNFSTSSSLAGSAAAATVCSTSGFFCEIRNEFIIHGVLITVVCCVGLLANVICLLVMSRPALRRGRGSSVNVVLTSMAAVDIIVLVSSLSMCGLPGIVNYAMLVRQWTPKWIGEKLPVMSSLLTFVTIIALFSVLA